MSELWSKLGEPLCLFLRTQDTLSMQPALIRDIPVLAGYVQIRPMLHNDDTIIITR